MKKILTFLAMMLIMSITALAKGDKMPQYDITGAGSGNEGKVLVKVYIYAKNATDEDLKRCAVHGIVFRGCTGNNSGANQPAMASPTVENDNATFCQEFFALDGMCQNYASIISGSYDRVKTSKGYKVGAIVEVSKTPLRKELEKAGIVRSLSAGF